MLDLVFNVKFTIILEKVELRGQFEIGQCCAVEVGFLLEYFF